MTNLNDGTIYLRALEPDDAAILYEWENDPSVQNKKQHFLYQVLKM